MFKDRSTPSNRIAIPFVFFLVSVLLTIFSCVHALSTTKTAEIKTVLPSPGKTADFSPLFHSRWVFLYSAHIREAEKPDVLSPVFPIFFHSFHSEFDVIQTLESEPLYQNPTIVSKTKSRIKPQKLLIVSSENGFFGIQTEQGFFYIRPKKFVELNHRSKWYRLDNTFSLYTEPNLAKKTDRTISELYVPYIRKNENWLQIQLNGNGKEEYYINLNEHTKVAYLTFDDGPNSNTPEILNILKTKNAKATFFMLEPQMRKYQSMVLRMVREGHYPALHGVTHDAKLYKEPPSKLANEMETARKAVLKITGIDTRLVRVPYGSMPYLKKPFRDKLYERNFKLWDWTVDSEDWRHHKDPEKILTQIKKQLKEAEKRKQPIIILMHDRKQTVKVLPKVIDFLYAEGYNLIPYNPESFVSFNFWNDERL